MTMVKFMHQTNKNRTKYIPNEVVFIRRAQGFKKHFAAKILAKLSRFFGSLLTALTVMSTAFVCNFLQY